MDPVARKNLNLEVLKRHDANICDILDQSAHAVVYKFDTEKTSWEKLGYEGVIFLTQGKSAPYFGLYVLNRLSIENFSLHLTDFEEITLTDEFIIYQTSEGEACALWLFEKKDRERILAKILKLHEGMKALPSTQQPKQVESKVDILQMLKKASNTSPLDTVGNDLIKALRGNQQQQQQQQLQEYRGPVNNMNMPMPMPMNNNNTIPTSESSERAGNRLQELFDTANGNNNHNNIMHENGPRRAIANGELTKPFYPPFMNMSPANSPRNPGALLQALHGGIPPPPPPSVPQMGIPLMPQQVIGLMRPEVNRRFAGARPILSKPEFIQQLLNMIQCDPTFFDILYENYTNQTVPPPSQQQQQQM